MRYYFFIFLVLFTFTACMNHDDPDINVTVNARLANDILNDASDTLIIEDRSYVLDAFLWRDFMPGDLNDHSLTAVNYLIAVDSLPIPSYLDLRKQYVILNDSIWTPEYTDQRDTSYDFRVSRISREGPQWGINKSVSVVAEVADTHDETDTHYIKVENITIVATY